MKELNLNSRGLTGWQTARWRATQSLWPLTVTLLLMSVLVIGTGCRPAIDGHGHDHDGEPRMAQITVWTDRYEVFAEHRAAVAAQATRFITHVTELGTAEPRREGSMKFVLRQGDKVTEHLETAPAQAGIYTPDLHFPQAGDWQLSLLVPADATHAPVDMGVIKVYANQHAADHAEIPADPEGMILLKQQQWKIGVKTEPITRQRLVERVRTAARVRAKPGYRGAVIAPVSGQVMAPTGRALPQPGERVEAGQLLVLLQPNFSEAAARLAEADGEFHMAKAVLDQAEAAYARTKMLAAEQAKSARELQEAERVYRSAQARYAAATGLLATFRQAGGDWSSDAPLFMELRAPIAGVLDSMAAGPGEVVPAGQTLFTVLNPELVWIEANIPEASVERLSAAKGAWLELPGQPGHFVPVTEEGRGRLVSLGLEVDLATRTVPLIYEMRNTGYALRIGQWVSLQVETAWAEEALALPDEAIVEERGRPLAYVQLSGETFERRDLVLGIRDGNRVQILSGIAEGERVVTQGAYAVKLASVSSALPAHGHAH